MNLLFHRVGPRPLPRPPTAPFEHYRPAENRASGHHDGQKTDVFHSWTKRDRLTYRGGEQARTTDLLITNQLYL